MNRRWALPGLLAPLALLFPWAAVPSNLGVALASWAYFRAWLTKYPTVAGVNHEVFLGVSCLVVLASVPLLVSVYRLKGGHNLWHLGAATLGVLLAYAPVLLRLDATLVLVGVFGAPTIASVDPSPAYEALGGPLLRLAAVIGTVALTVRARSA